MLELVFEFLMHFFVECFGQLIVELAVELGLRSIFSTVGPERYRHPLLSALGYALLGTIFGGLSLLFFKEHFIKNYVFRYLNIILTPILVGLVMGLRGKHLKKRQRQVIRLDTFSYGFLFAFTFAIIRLIYAK